MPLFVPILRLLMLFLNVYDSYKTLKDPPTSSRNAGRPSVRAVSQRKRDMKGCLAVWIVWASLSMYERILENIVCLFIPFYDEFKSLALLFLILTRARGAEPIYLHLIRPLIKPYTRTLDAGLELMLMIGDFMFALSTYPIRLGLEWYRKRFGTFYESSESEPETQSDSSNDVNTSELPTSFLASSGAAQAVLGGNIDPPQLPNKSSKEKVAVESPSRRPSGDATAPGISRKKKPETVAENPDLEPNFLDSKRTQEPLQRRPGPPSRKNTRKNSQLELSKINGIPDNLEPNFFKPQSRREDEGSSRHQIWYPPKSSYVDEDVNAEADLTLRPKQAGQAPLTSEQQEYEEWRQYPAFPSAYPPTPLATTSRLATTSAVVSSSLYPAIDEEDKIQQDFRKSLLPPREPLNPSHAGDSSDKYKFFGITLSPDMDDADDSMSADDDEDEDEFNITLRTPLPPFGSLRSQIQPRRIVSIASTSSAASVPSRSSALTTADNGSSMQIGTSSDSSLSAPKPNTTSPSVIGKKRSYPRTKTPAAKYRVRQIESETSQDVSESDQDLDQIAATLKEDPRISPSSGVQLAIDDSAVASSNNSSAEEQDRVPREEKRRKIVRSIPPPRPVNSSRPVRPRVARRASPPTQEQKTKLQDISGVPIKRSSVRLRSGLSTGKVKENDDPSSLSASSSASMGDLPAPPVPPKPSKRNMTRKR